MAADDTEKAIPLTAEQIAYATAHGLTVVNVVGYSAAGARVVSFIAMVKAVPPRRERVECTDGRVFKVRRVHHKVVTHEHGGRVVGHLMMPNVLAILVDAADVARSSITLSGSQSSRSHPPPVTPPPKRL